MWLLLTSILSKCYLQSWHTFNTEWTVCVCLSVCLCTLVSLHKHAHVFHLLSKIIHMYSTTVYSSPDTDMTPHTYLSSLHISSIHSYTSQRLSWNNKTGKVK
jgi:hypothetical protein